MLAQFFRRYEGDWISEAVLNEEFGPVWKLSLRQLREDGMNIESTVIDGHSEYRYTPPS